VVIGNLGERVEIGKAQRSPAARRGTRGLQEAQGQAWSLLDRLARNVACIANLMDGKVDFVCCDMPQATRLTIHVLAAVAEHEREMISERTRNGLAAAKVCEARRPKTRGHQQNAPSRLSQNCFREQDLSLPIDRSDREKVRTSISRGQY
jgi:DNA invertase Pin-like site-specific DNA recombinase